MSACLLLGHKYYCAPEMRWLVILQTIYTNLTSETEW